MVAMRRALAGAAAEGGGGHGEERVREALEACLGGDGRFDELALRRSLAGAGERREVVVPEALRGYHVERASARDYDRLLPGGAL